MTLITQISSAPLAVVAQLPTTTAPTISTSGVRPPKECGAGTSFVCDVVKDWTDSDAWGAFADFVVTKPLTILLILIITVIVNRIVRRLIKRAMNRVLNPPAPKFGEAIRRATPSLLARTGEFGNIRIDARVQTMTTVLRSIATVIIWFFSIVAILEVLTINLAAFWAPASIIGVAVGFGAQNIVKDFLAGVFIVIEDQLGVGDTVDLGNDAKGTVEEITLRSTRVRDVHGTLWHVPNGEIKRVANKSQQWARAVLDIEVDGGTEYGPAAALLERVAQGLAADPAWMHDVLATPEVWGIESFTEHGYVIRLVTKTRPASQFGLMRELRIRIKGAFREAGIRMPGDPEPSVDAPVVDTAALLTALASGHAPEAGDGSAGKPETEPAPRPAEPLTDAKQRRIEAKVSSAEPERQPRGDPSEAG